MSRRKIAWIVLGVVAAHLAAFAIFSRMRALPKARYVPPPNFGYKQTTWVDPATGEKTIEREIRVTTKLAPDGTYEARPKSEGEMTKQPPEAIEAAAEKRNTP